MDNFEITFLSEEETMILGKILDVLIDYGFLAATTDLAYLTGAAVTSITVPDEQSKKGRCAPYWTKTYKSISENQLVRVISPFSTSWGNSWRSVAPDNTQMAIRPVIKLSSELFEELTKNKTIGYKNTEEVKLGEYPQYAPSKETHKELEKLYALGKLEKTNKIYTFVNLSEDGTESLMQMHQVYIYQGRKFIRTKSNITEYKSKRLTNDLRINSEAYYWIEVSPVKWLVDEGSRTLISKNVLLAGIEFDKNKEFVNDSFEKTSIYEFINEYMIPEMGFLCNTKNIINITFQKLIEELGPNLISDISQKIKEDDTLSKEELEQLKGALEQAKNETTKSR